MASLKYYLVAPVAKGGTKLESLTYHFDQSLTPGQLVQIPLTRRKIIGVVTSETTKPKFNTKSIDRIIEVPPLPQHLLELGNWIHEYYVAGLPAVWQTMLPAGLAKKRREKVIEASGPAKSGPIKLTDEQKKAFSTIINGKGRSYLVEGVTGSGKTELYLELAKNMFESDHSVIVLVPEIALTAQIVDRFSRAFPGHIIVNHSGLSEVDRHKAWLDALTSSRPKIVVGPRSSLFLPVPKLGLVIIDECHDTSYKQDQAPRYQATAVAAKLCSLTSAKLVMGSATPSVNEVFLAKKGRIQPLYLTKRYGTAASQIKIVDLRDKSVLSRSQFLSEPLLKAINDTLQNGKQALLFLNRRGSATCQLCGACGESVHCPNCHLPLTFHADLMRLVCHWCNHRELPPATCPNCGGSDWRYLGSGTKRIEAELTALFPYAKILRLDRDSFDPKTIDQTYAALKRGDFNLIVGTQMIAKGFDLPNLETVGIVLADGALNLADFSASERTFQLILQAAGRAGRREPGQIVLQTYAPSHPAIKFAAAAHLADFADQELAQRQLLKYPPYVYVAKLVCSKKTTTLAEKNALDLAQKLSQNSNLTVLGPAPAFHEYQAGKYRWQIGLKAQKRADLVAAAQNLPTDWTFDLDPVSLL